MVTALKQYTLLLKFNTWDKFNEVLSIEDASARTILLKESKLVVL